MSSKMREALREAMGFAWREGYACRVSHINQDNWSCEPALSEIAQRYGDLEFTREEVRGMLDHLYEEAYGRGRFAYSSLEEKHKIINNILSRHTESRVGECPNPRCQSWGCAKCDASSGEASDIESLTKRVAALERRVLADGHSEYCVIPVRRRSPTSREMVEEKCTCGHDEIRDNSK